MWGLRMESALAKNAELVLGKLLVIYGFDYESVCEDSAKGRAVRQTFGQVHVQQADVHDELGRLCEGWLL